MNNSPEHIELAIYPASARFEVEARLGEAEFACDLSVCKGACCTMPGGRGAPLIREEIAEIERVFPLVKHYLRCCTYYNCRIRIMAERIDGTYTVSTIGHKECILSPGKARLPYAQFKKAFRNGE